MKNKTLIIKISFAIALIALAVSWRIINHNYNFAPNLELVTVATVLAATIIGFNAAITVPVISMVVSDLIIGNSSIFVFTWSSFAIIGLGAILLRKLNNKPKKQIVYSLGFAAASSFMFFLITNLGVWLQGWYPATLSGLVDCFTMAIPFYRTMIVGNLILVPTAITIWQIAKIKISSKNLVINTLIGK